MRCAGRQSCIRAARHSAAHLTFGTRSWPSRQQACTNAKSSRLRVSAWGAEVAFHPATIKSKSRNAGKMWVLHIEADKKLAESYTNGGQYVQVKVKDGKPVFLAVASSPASCAQGTFEFLIKDIPEGTAHDVIELAEGDEVMMSAAMGKGFPVEKVPPATFDTMLIFATGSGVAPIKALIEAGSLHASDRKDVRLYYGAPDNDNMAYKKKIPAWQESGIKVNRVLSARGEGYVQDVYVKDAPPADPSRTCVLLCGQKEMAEAVREVVSEQGVSLDNVLTNF